MGKVIIVAYKANQELSRLKQELSWGDAIKERSLGHLIAMFLFGLGYECDGVDIIKEGGEGK